MSVASRAMAWERKYRNIPGPMGRINAAGDENTRKSPKVEMLINGIWTDITYKGIRYNNKITITRGRKGEDDKAPPQTCKFTANNRGGWLSPRNPNGEFFGYIGVNTPVRVYKYHGENRKYRFSGELSDLPVRSDKTGRDVWVDVEASGPLRRLNQGDDPLDSSLTRTISNASPSWYAYWPMEELDKANSIASGIVGPTARPMRITGSVDFTTDVAEIPDGSSGAAKAGDQSTFDFGLLTGSVIGMPDDVDWCVSYWINITGTGVQFPIVQWHTPNASTYTYWEVEISTGIGVAAITEDLSTIITACAAASTDIRNQGPTHIVVSGVDDGAGGINVFIWVNGVSVGAQANAGAGTTAGIKDVKVAWGSGIQGTVSHLVFGSGGRASPEMRDEIYAAGIGHAGEQPGTRLQRLCNEEDVPILFINSATFTEEVGMGIQTPDSLISLLHQCEDAGFGLLHEHTETYDDRPSLLQRSRLSRYNQDPILTLDYANHELDDALEPLDDDSSIINDFTSQRIRGSKYHAEVTTGARSTALPPNGVGKYKSSDEISIELDEDLPDHVGWKLHLGTVDEARYPTLKLNLTHPSWTDAQLDIIYGLYIGDRIVVTNVPSETLPPDDLSLVVVGYTEVIDQFTHYMTLNCVPESPYQVAIVDDTNKRVETDGATTVSEFRVGIDSTVQIATNEGPICITTAEHPGDFPFNISVAGVVLQVTGVTGSSSPQTFTITSTPVNGVIKAIPAGSDVHVTNKSYVAL